MEPPMTRMDNERAMVVAMNLSAATVIAMVEGGTSTPPTPNPATVPNATASLGLCGLTAARAPVNAATRFVSLLVITYLGINQGSRETHSLRCKRLSSAHDCWH